MTNGDKYRQMTDVELARELLAFEALGHVERNITPYEERLAWLQKEAEQEEK